MYQRTARLQYFLLAVVAALALLHAYGGGVVNYNLLAHGDTLARLPFNSGYPQDNSAGNSEETRAAGLQPSDIIVSINGQPYTGRKVVLDQIRHSSPGNSMAITSRRGPNAPIQ